MTKQILVIDDEEFCRIFADAGFFEKAPSFGADQQGLVQYILARKN